MTRQIPWTKEELEHACAPIPAPSSACFERFVDWVQGEQRAAVGLVPCDTTDTYMAIRWQGWRAAWERRAEQDRMGALSSCRRHNPHTSPLPEKPSMNETQELIRELLAVWQEAVHSTRDSQTPLVAHLSALLDSAAGVVQALAEEHASAVYLATIRYDGGQPDVVGAYRTPEEAKQAAKDYFDGDYDDEACWRDAGPDTFFLPENLTAPWGSGYFVKIEELEVRP